MMNHKAKSSTDHTPQALVRYIANVLVAYAVLISVSACSSSQITVTDTPVVLRSPTISVPTVTFTPTPTPISSMPTAVAPTSTRMEDIEMKVAFVTFEGSGTQVLSKLWLLRPPREASVVLTSGPENVILGSWIAWSHSGQFVAFAHMIQSSVVAISTLDIDTLQQRKLAFSFPVEPFGSTASSSTRVELLPESWSLNDEWLHATVMYTRPSDSEPIRKEVILSAAGDRIVELDEKTQFVAWSPAASDQYAYIERPNYPKFGNETLNIGQVGQTKSLKEISNFGNYIPQESMSMAWAPDGKSGIAVFFDSINGKDVILSIDLFNGEWRLLRETGNVFALSWSPDGSWIGMVGSRDLYFLRATHLGDDLIRVRAQQSPDYYVEPKTWMSGSTLIYQDGSIIYVVSPSAPETPMPILDLGASGIKSDQQITTSIWASLKAVP